MKCKGSQIQRFLYGSWYSVYIIEYVIRAIHSLYIIALEKTFVLFQKFWKFLEIYKGLTL